MKLQVWQSTVFVLILAGSLPAEGFSLFTPFTVAKDYVTYGATSTFSFVRDRVLFPVAYAERCLGEARAALDADRQTRAAEFNEKMRKMDVSIALVAAKLQYTQGSLDQGRAEIGSKIVEYGQARDAVVQKINTVLHGTEQNQSNLMQDLQSSNMQVQKKIDAATALLQENTSTITKIGTILAEAQKSFQVSMEQDRLRQCELQGMVALLANKWGVTLSAKNANGIQEKSSLEALD